MKQAIITCLINDDTSEDAFRDWANTCPFAKQHNLAVTFADAEGAPEDDKTDPETQEKAEGNGESGDSAQSGETENAGETTTNGEETENEGQTDAPQEGSGVAPVNPPKDDDVERTDKFAA